MQSGGESTRGFALCLSDRPQPSKVDMRYGKNKHLKKERLDEIDKALSASYKLAKKSMEEAHEYLKKVITAPVDENVTEYTAIEFVSKKLFAV